MTLHIKKQKSIEQDVLTLARERIAKAFDLFDFISVSFSGGKDSTVCLHLTVEEAEKRGRLPVEVVFFDEEAVPRQTDDYLRRVIGHFGEKIDFKWLCIPIKHRNACSKRQPWWSPWDPGERDLWVRPLPPEALTEVDGVGFDVPVDQRPSIPELCGALCPPEVGNAGMVLGIRSEESLIRRRAILMSKNVNEAFIKRWDPAVWGKSHVGQTYHNVWKIYPIYDWRHQDVWTAPKQFGWDYNQAYDVMDKAGIRIGDQRVCPPYGEEPIRGLWLYSVCFPELWERMIYRVKGANTAAKYAQTALYGYGRDAKLKPPDMTWMDWTRYLVKKWAPKERTLVVERISSVIKRHYGKTRDPILDMAFHPKTGVSWRYLAMLADRGDFKARRNEMMNIGSEKEETLWKLYREERNAKGAEGATRF